MNKYITVMFPYPSGSGLHAGHAYCYTIVDSYCKIQKYQGHNVYQPIGWDAFGLPTENYAIKMGRDAREVSIENIDNFKRQMEYMNTSFEEKLNTSSPEYIEKTQWIFTELLERGLAYKANREQCYCPSCKTILSNEQVIGSKIVDGLPLDGKCERCSTPIEPKEMEQWFFKITDYKQRLIDDLDKVDYPEKTKKQQRHWLNNIRDWCVSRQRKWGCPIPIDGEEDTLDTFVDSSFYTIEYDRTRPVDIYVGGNEHATTHLIFARFITKFLFDIGYIDFDEPFKKVIHNGFILGEDGEKMSKTRGNVIDPTIYDPQILRMFLMFINHFFEGGKWQDNGYKGCERFRNKLMTWINSSDIDYDDNIDFGSFETKVINYFESWKTNKVVSEWMIFYNKNKNIKPSINTSNKIFKFFNTCF